MGQQPNEARTIVVIGEGRGAETTAAMLAAAAIRREGYALLSDGGSGAPLPAGPGLSAAHQLARGTRGLVVAAAARPLHWQQIVDRAHQVVIATTTADVDSAVAKLQALHGWGGRAPALASGAVVVLARADARHPAPSEVTHRFDGLARATLVVPHDPHASTDPMGQAQLPPVARSAWDRVVQVVSADELPEDEMDTQPRIDVRDLFAGTPGAGAATVAAGPTFGPPVLTGGSATSGSRLPRRGVLAAGAGALVVALVLATFAVRAVVGGDDGGGVVASGEAPVEPVHGWTREAEWISPDITPAGQSASVLVREGAAITTTGDPAHPDLVALRASDGSQLWSSPIDGELTGPPQLIPWGDATGIIAATSNELYLWPSLGAEGSAPTPQTWSFTEADVTLVAGSPVPLLANEETLTALVLHDGALRKRALPSGATPIAGDDEGRVLSVDSRAHWWSSSDDGEITDGALLAPPVYGSLPGDVLGVGGTTLVVNWTLDDKITRLAGYDVTDQMELTWETTVPGRVAIADFDLAPDGTWAIAGRVVVDVATGKKSSLTDDWDTTRVIGDRAWSRDGVAGRDGRVTRLPEPLSGREDLPIAVTGDGLGLVVAAEGDGPSRIYALRPDPDA